MVRSIVGVVLVQLTVLVVTTRAGGESPTLESAARRYRIRVYNTFRTDRPRYNEFRRAGDHLWQQWEASNGSEEAKHELLAWYIRADESLAAGSKVLPASPDISALVESQGDSHHRQPRDGAGPADSSPTAEANVTADSSAYDSDERSAVIDPPVAQDTGTNPRPFSGGEDRTPTAKSPLRSLATAVWRAMTQ